MKIAPVGDFLAAFSSDGRLLGFFRAAPKGLEILVVGPDSQPRAAVTVGDDGAAHLSLFADGSPRMIFTLNGSQPVATRVDAAGEPVSTAEVFKHEKE